MSARTYQPPTGKKPGRLTAHLHGGKGNQAKPPPSHLADELHNATFGERASQLAQADWHTAHHEDAE